MLGIWTIILMAQSDMHLEAVDAKSFKTPPFRLNLRASKEKPPHMDDFPPLQFPYTVQSCKKIVSFSQRGFARGYIVGGSENDTYIYALRGLI